MGVTVLAYVVMWVIVWVRRGYGWGSLDCCSKVCVWVWLWGVTVRACVCGCDCMGVKFQP